MTPHRKKPNINTTPVDISDFFGFAVSVDCVIFGFDENVLKVLLIKSDLEEFMGKWSLLGDLVQLDEDLESASYRVLKERTGLDNVYLEQVYTFSGVDRHPAGRELLEIPAGRIEEGETPEQCAQREIEDETASRPEQLEKLAEFYSTPGFCAEKLYVYLATQLRPSSQSLDHDERLNVVRMPFKEALALVHSGEIEDSKTIVALLLAEPRLKSLV